MNRPAATLFAAIAANPSIAAGTCTFAVAFALVAGNAFYGQPGIHPVPLWATRAASNAAAVRAANGDQQRIDVAVSSHVPVPFVRPDPNAANAPVSPLVRDLQTALRQAGLYQGPIDGIAGRMTREAIMRFETANSLDETGLPSARLLAAVENSASGGDEIRPKITVLSVIPVAIRSAAPPAPEPADVSEAALIARIKFGLINFGETRIDVDGVLGSQTAEAIRGFERRYKLPVTGKPSQSVVDKLEQVGALKKS